MSSLPCLHGGASNDAVLVCDGGDYDDDGIVVMRSKRGLSIYYVIQCNKLGRPLYAPPIPHNCHFFTQIIFLENEIYTGKRQFFALNL